MGRKKKSRKIKSANKLLKKQREQLNAVHVAQLAVMGATSAATIQAVAMSKKISEYKEGGLISPAHVDDKEYVLDLHPKDKAKDISKILEDLSNNVIIREETTKGQPEETTSCTFEVGEMECEIDEDLL